jgi:hypothetical protein
VTATGVPRAALQAATTPDGRAVAAAAVALAVLVALVADRVAAGLAALAAAALSGSALGGDVVRTLADDLGGTGRLALRSIAVAATAVAGAVLVGRRRRAPG